MPIYRHKINRIKVQVRPEITVAVPVRNEEKNLHRLLQRLKRQKTSHAYEILIIDNNSTDRSREIAQRYDVRIVSEKKIGIPFARLRAFKNSASAILVFIDADSVPDIRWLERLTTHFFKKKKLAICYGRTLYPKTASFSAKIFNVGANFLRSLTFSAPMFAGGNNFAIRRSMLKRIRNFGINLEAKWFDDAAFFYTLKRHQLHSLYISNARIVTSPRRLERLGMIYYVLCNLHAFLQYWMTGSFPKWVYQREYTEIR